jgi:hypothetical protein
MTHKNILSALKKAFLNEATEVSYESELGGKVTAELKGDIEKAHKLLTDKGFRLVTITHKPGRETAFYSIDVGYDFDVDLTFIPSSGNLMMADFAEEGEHMMGPRPVTTFEKFQKIFNVWCAECGID